MRWWYAASASRSAGSRWCTRLPGQRGDRAAPARTCRNAELVLRPRACTLARCLGVEQLPLVQHEHDRGAGGVDALGEALVLVGHAFGRVDEEQRGIGAVDRLQRAHEAVVLGRLVDAALAAQAGGVDEAQRAVVGLDDGVDRVARRAGHVVHDRALLADEPVEQRRLADVGPADDRDREDPVVGIGVAASSSVVVRSGSGGSAATIASSNSPDRRPCSAETGTGSPSPRRANCQISASRRSSSTLLTATITGVVAALQHARDARVLLGDAGDDVDDEHDHVGRPASRRRPARSPWPRARAPRR